MAGYNAQAMVSPVETAEGAAGMLVTAVDVVDAANDNALLAPMVDQAEETNHARPTRIQTSPVPRLWPVPCPGRTFLAAGFRTRPTSLRARRVAQRPLLTCGL